MSEELYDLLLPPGVHLPAREAARRLESILGGPVPDLARRIRYGGGWLARGETRERAEEIERVLADLGHGLLVVPQEESVGPPTVERVLSASRNERELHLQLPHAAEIIDLSELACADLVVLGRIDRPDPKEEEKSRQWVGSALRGLVVPPHREALTNCELMDALPTLFLVRREPVEFYRLERGTLFPEIAERGIRSALDSFLTFTGEVFDALPPERLLPEARHFWETAEVEAITMHDRVELDRRLAWLDEILRRELWEEFR